MRLAVTWVRLSVVLVCCTFLCADHGSSEPLGVRRTQVPGKSLTGIVDLHCHVAGIGKGSGCFVGSKLRRSYKFKIYMRAMGVTPGVLERRGDALVVERLASAIAQSRCVGQAVILALDGVIVNGRLDRDRTQVYVPDEFVAEQAARFPVLLFGASINPERKDAIERLRWAKQHGAVLVKWIPSIMLFDPANPQYDPFYDELVRLDLPLLVHVGQERSFIDARDELCDPMRLTRALERGVRIIAAHVASSGRSGGEANYDRLVRLISRYPKLYADISSLTQINRIGALQRALKEPRFAGRLVYGTDWPLQFFPLVSPVHQIGRVALREIRRVSRISNIWDRDVELKKAIGVPEDVFTRGRWLLKIPPAVPR